MNQWKLISAVLFAALSGCGSSAQKMPLIVEIHDERIDDDICAAVYSYAKTAIELGRGDSRGQFRVNGHLWRSFTPLTGNAIVVAEFSPTDYTSHEDIANLIKSINSENLFFWINLDGQEPAKKLFLLMDFVEEAELNCWINPTEEAVESSIRVYALAKTETRAEQSSDGKVTPSTSLRRNLQHP